MSRLALDISTSAVYLARKNSKIVSKMNLVSMESKEEVTAKVDLQDFYEF